MKRIAYVEDIKLTNIHGDPVIGFSGNGVAVGGDPAKDQSIVMTQREFLLQRMVDAKFAAPREGIEASEFVIAARDEINSQASQAKERGYWEIEDDRAKALREPSLHPTGGYNVTIQHCLLPFLIAVRDMKDAPKEEVKANGATAAEASAS